MAKFNEGYSNPGGAGPLGLKHLGNGGWDHISFNKPRTANLLTEVKGHIKQVQSNEVINTHYNL